MYNLPIEAYTSKEWFDNEKKLLFEKNWQFAGFEKDLSDVGDHLCVYIGNSHLMVLRNETGELIALHTECRHRGNRISSVSKQKQHYIQCPYHKWTYNLNGDLIAVPEAKEFEHLDKKNLRLVKGSVVVWHDMIFVHSDEKAPTFDDFIKPLLKHLGPHKLSLLKEYESNNNSYMVNCNWKIFVENYMDGYHLPYLHEKSLNMYDHSKQVSSFAGPHWTFFEPLQATYLKQRRYSKYYYLPFIDHIPDNQLGAFVHLVFPNLGISETETAWSTFRIIPISVNVTLIEYRSFVMPQAVSGKKRKNEAKVIKTSDYDAPLETGDFMLEDMFVCENIQKVMESGKFNPGPMHMQKEDGLLTFQDIVKSHLYK